MILHRVRVVGLALMCVIAGGVMFAPGAGVDRPAPLAPVSVPRHPLLVAEPLDLKLAEQREPTLRALDYSLQYLNTPRARAVYADSPYDLETIRRSTAYLRHLVATAPDGRTLDAWLRQSFDWHRARGDNGRGQVLFTGYYEPIFRASLVPGGPYQHPIYARPPNFGAWPRPHPSRAELTDGARLAGLELAWLADPFEAILLQIQGSGRLRLPDGAVMTVGYAGHTDYPYRSIGAALIRDGHFEPGGVDLPGLRRFFDAHPELLHRYALENDRFVFFRNTHGRAAVGSLGVPVTGGHTVATDKALFPPGAPAIVRVPDPTAPGEFLVRIVADQDTGGAIRGPGRADLFLGTGAPAERVAGRLAHHGHLDYLIVRPTARLASGTGSG